VLVEVATVIAVVALVVAAITAWATFFGPTKAAQLAENLRAGSAKVERQETLKTWVFATLMQERATPYTADAAKAFNLIDFVFADVESVREAWKIYFASLDESAAVPLATQRDHFHKLLVEMAKELGLSKIKGSDVGRIYSPRFLVRRMAVDDMQVALQEGALKKALAENSANTTPQGIGSVFN
jgi:hypothetical protein